MFYKKKKKKTRRIPVSDFNYFGLYSVLSNREFTLNALKVYETKSGSLVRAFSLVIGL